MTSRPAVSVLQNSSFPNSGRKTRFATNYQISSKIPSHVSLRLSSWFVGLTILSTTHLVPKLSEKDLIQTLVSIAPDVEYHSDAYAVQVLQFLQHDGYIDTARTFADEIQTERRALAVGNRTVNDIHVKDDQHATNRQCM